MRFEKALLGIALSLLASCSSAPAIGPGERAVTLPDGTTIVAELLTRPEDMARGMMYRDSLPPNRGMLFMHDRAGRYPYWMHNVKVPLDIIWLDKDRRVTEISPNTPGCEKPAEQCPSYGGGRDTLYVLELAGGQAARYKVAEGAQLDF